MYDASRQYRCTIIRGKSQQEMDDLLPAYAQIIDEICPCPVSDFEQLFDNAFRRFLPGGSTKKTLDNHRTEISGKLFGMYYLADDGMVYSSDRTKKFLADSDTPAFFKDICYKMQFPNGTQKIQTVQERIDAEICIRPNAFLLKVLTYAKNAGLTLTKKEIGYYVLNSLDVLQGKADPLEVIDAITYDRKHGIERIIRTPGKASSYNYQHINEQINLLELANLVITDNGVVSLNPRESDAIAVFADDYNKKPAFDVYSYDLSTVELRKKFYLDWDFYFSQISDKSSEFETSIGALGITTEPESGEGVGGGDKTEIGDEGELYVYEYERKRVAAFNFRLVGKVIHLGKTRGLGYDIQSVVAKPGDDAEFVKYIEVKSTKRITVPDISDSSWIDTLNITRNEWVAAQQHKDFYSIFRVYFVRDSIIMYVITDLAKKYKDGIIQAVPTAYRVDFGNNAVDEVITD